MVVVEALKPARAFAPPVPAAQSRTIAKAPLDDRTRLVAGRAGAGFDLGQRLGVDVWRHGQNHAAESDDG